VPDVRPYIAHAAFSVAPLRIARGVQNKVLEAMAMGKAVLATAAAMEGIGSSLQEGPGGVLVADDPAALARQALALLANRADAEQRGCGNRTWVLRHYDWDGNLSRMAAVLE
jgi:glycosyltransferase involved in cell wall biosynthesis